MTTSAYVGEDTKSSVNLTIAPILCVVVTGRPLPPAAWKHVGELAAAIDKCARMLKAAGAEVREPEEAP